MPSDVLVKMFEGDFVEIYTEFVLVLHWLQKMNVCKSHLGVSVVSAVYVRCSNSYYKSLPLLEDSAISA